MALTAYCKKCAREVEPGDICPRCGSRIAKSAIHAAWCVEKAPARDWMSWNAAARILFPSALAVLLLVIAAEALSGGSAAVENLFRSGFPAVVAALLCAALLLILIVFLLQGHELTDYVIDSRGVHVTTYLPDPTPLKLILRLKSPGLASATEQDGASVLRLSGRDLAWKDVYRVQLWPEKCAVLFYSPSWWLRIPVFCTPYTWDDTLGFIRDKLGRKKKVLLPPSLVVSAPPARRKAKPQARLVPEVEEAIEQLRMEEHAADEAPDDQPLKNMDDIL